MIYQLKRAGINQIDSVRIYVSVIRPVVEYACPVRHMNLPKYLSNNIEIIKKTVSQNYISWFYVRECSADGKHTNAARQAQCDM